MTARPYHHGNLREALLAQAEQTIRQRGVAALSLRELARDAGVSHGAPRRHFPDRQALLDALALVGFQRLGSELRAAVEQAPPDFPAQLRAAARAYIGFATQDAELLELMFAGKHGEHAAALEQAADDAFAVMLELILRGQADGVLPPGDPERVGLVHLASIQGIASLLNGGMVRPEQVEWLVDGAVGQFLAAATA
ncbi:MAG TPA: TetR/AcrR family transcriptional regulator [Solirubrobacteraceae bacterium]|jgi:AcrR family transcriptional regulator|nr:TetR/AcrR family transcriptional regulator [Solirubrobacteraceae bacterium]